MNYHLKQHVAYMNFKMVHKLTLWLLGTQISLNNISIKSSFKNFETC